MVYKHIHGTHAHCPSRHLGQDSLDRQLLLNCQLLLQSFQFVLIAENEAQASIEILVLAAEGLVLSVDASGKQQGLTICGHTVTCCRDGPAERPDNALNPAECKVSERNAIRRQSDDGRQREKQRYEQQASGPAGRLPYRTGHSLYQNLVQQIVVLEDLACALGDTLQWVLCDTDKNTRTGGDKFVKAHDKCAAARKHDTAVDNVC